MGEFDKVERILNKTAKGFERGAAYHSLAQHVMGIEPWTLNYQRL